MAKRKTHIYLLHFLMGRMIRTIHLYLILTAKNEVTILVLAVYHPGLLEKGIQTMNLCVRACS